VGRDRRLAQCLYDYYPDYPLAPDDSFADGEIRLLGQSLVARVLRRPLCLGLEDGLPFTECAPGALLAHLEWAINWCVASRAHHYLMLHAAVIERNGHALRVVSPDGRIRTVVNIAGKKGATGDGGEAALATMSGPKHLCIDRDDSVLIADAENNLIRRYVPATGKILRVAGTGKKGAAGLGGPPEQCELARPHGVTVARDGTLYITDSYNDRILKIVK
jgi:sugar lactone lactonase YvrE